MGLFDIFRRPPPIRSTGELADFIDAQAAFLAQKGVYEYARARAGHYAKVLFKEPEFLKACDVSRWQTFPMALAMVGEMAEGFLVPAWQDDRAALSDAVRRVVLGVFDRYGKPDVLDALTWTRLREELDQHLKRVSLHAPKMVKDISEPFYEKYFDLMPIHEQLRTRDALTTQGFLSVTLINIHNELSKRADAGALTQSLQGVR